MEKWKNIFWLIFIILSYFFLMNLLESEGTYKIEKRSFNLDVNYIIENNSCLEFEPVNLFYYNDVKKYNSEEKNKNIIELQMFLHRPCDFEKGEVYIMATDLINISIVEDDNGITIEKENESKFKISLDNLNNKTAQEVKLKLDINKNFFNKYWINSNMGLNYFYYYYKKGIFGGLIANEGSFFIYNVENYTQEPIIYDLAKKFNFNGAKHFFLVFTPKNKFLVFLERLLDGIFIGLFATLVYNIFFEKRKKELKK